MLTEIAPYLRSLWTVWFFLLFVALVVSTLLPRRRAQFEQIARIPLEDEPNAGGTRDVR